MPKHTDIFENLLQRIRGGAFGPDKRLPSEMELAQRFRVSRPTAARALRDLQTMGLIERRVGSGTYLRPSAPPAATRTLGLLVPGLAHTEILDPVCTHITQAAQSQGLGIALTERATASAKPFIERKVDGVFFAPVETVTDREAINTAIVDELRAAGIAVVLLDRDVTEFPRRSRFDLVGIDSFQAAYTLAEHLLDVGHRSFRFVAKPGYPATTDLRIAGCREAIERRGIHVDRKWSHFGDPGDEQFVLSLLKGKPDVIVCSNDLTAALLIQTLTSLGLRVPQDVGVAGFDDVHYATLLSTPLTTVRQPCDAIARAAVATTLSRIENPHLPPRQVLLAGELVVRQSCGGKRRTR